jgi:hypothetical protein
MPSRSTWLTWTTFLQIFSNHTIVFIPRPQKVKSGALCFHPCDNWRTSRVTDPNFLCGRCGVTRGRGLSKTSDIPHPRWLLWWPYWKHKKHYYSWTNGSVESKFVLFLSSEDTWHLGFLFDLRYFSRSQFNMNYKVGTFCNCCDNWPETLYICTPSVITHMTYHTNIRSDIFLGLATRWPKP